MIKLLRVDKLIWMIICAVFVFLYMWCYALLNILYFIYCFKFLSWEKVVCKKVWIDYVPEYVPDKNPYRTYLRFYRGSVFDLLLD